MMKSLWVKKYNIFKCLSQVGGSSTSTKTNFY
jgi:hypothetical protein